MSAETTPKVDSLDAKIALLTERLEKIDNESIKAATLKELERAKEQQTARAQSIMQQMDAKIGSQVEIHNEIKASLNKAKGVIKVLQNAYDDFLGTKDGVAAPGPDTGLIGPLKEKIREVGATLSV